MLSYLVMHKRIYADGSQHNAGLRDLHETLGRVRRMLWNAAGETEQQESQWRASDCVLEVKILGNGSILPAQSSVHPRAST